MSTRMTIRGLFESEEKSVEKRLDVLEKSGMAKAFDLQLSLFHELLDEAENFSSGSPYEGGAVVTNGGLVPSWEMRLWVHMFVGSFVQFTMAISHILRGQASEAYGHVRHGIENSGIAHLAKSEPEIVEFYRTRDEKGMAKNYPTWKLFPKTEALTSDLNRMFRKASRHLHGNLYSNEINIIEEDSVDEGSRVVSSVTFAFGDGMSFYELWEVSYFVLAAGYYVLRLYGATFELPEAKWHLKLEAFKEDLDKSARKLREDNNEHFSH